MGYQIREVVGGAAENHEIAAFLAAFVIDRELPNPLRGDDEPAMWLQRMQWWWDDNPFSNDGSPQGHVLETEEGEIVGFSGYIPFEYSRDDEVIPSLMTTSLMVRERHRAASMGLLMKLRGLGRKYHIVDGSPSPQVREMLLKFGYHQAGDRKQYLYPVSGAGSRWWNWLLKPFEWLYAKLPVSKDSGLYFVNDPEKLGTIPTRRDGRIHRRLTVESLKWLSQSGTKKRSFVGLCQPDGSLLACAICVYKQRLGMTACIVMDYADFSEDGRGVTTLVRLLSEKPREAGLLPETNFIAWSVLGEKGRPKGFGLQRESILHYSLPKSHQPFEKASVPFENDIILL